MWRLTRLSPLTHHDSPDPLFAVAGSFVPVLCLVGMGVAMLEEEDVVMLLQMGSRTVSSRLMSDVVIACKAEHEDSPFWL